MAKRSAAQAFLDEPKPSVSTASTAHREMQGAGAGVKKHSLDSDDEEEYEVHPSLPHMGYFYQFNAKI